MHMGLYGGRDGAVSGWVLWRKAPPKVMSEIWRFVLRCLRSRSGLCIRAEVLLVLFL